jgi:hypothetical protein
MPMLPIGNVDGRADYYLESPNEDALSPLLIKPNQKHYPHLQIIKS